MRMNTYNIPSFRKQDSENAIGFCVFVASAQNLIWFSLFGPDRGSEDSGAGHDLFRTDSGKSLSTLTRIRSERSALSRSGKIWIQEVEGWHDPYRSDTGRSSSGLYPDILFAAEE